MEKKNLYIFFIFTMLIILSVIFVIIKYSKKNESYGLNYDQDPKSDEIKSNQECSVCSI
jgi:uncharacterized membrane protein